MSDENESPRQQLNNLITKFDELHDEAQAIQKQLTEVTGQIEQHQTTLRKSSHELDTVTELDKPSGIGPEIQDR